MEAHKIVIKWFVDNPGALQQSEFVPIFHSWIQAQAIPDHLLIDVADYQHVWSGPGTVLVAPGGRHLEFERVSGRTVARVAESVPADKYAPSVDRLFASAAKHFGADLLGVVLTGMGDDGRRGVVAVKEAGGTVVVESEETAVVFGMPQQAIRSGAVDVVLPLQQIPAVIESGVGTSRGRPEREGPA